MGIPGEDESRSGRNAKRYSGVKANGDSGAIANSDSDGKANSFHTRPGTVFAMARNVFHR